MLSNTCKYALRSIIYIGIKSTSTNLVNVRTIATDLDVPMQFLSKILQVYVRKGILNSVKGPSGGFNFKKDPSDVTLYELVTIIDGPELFDNCIIGTKPCNSSDSKMEKCAVHSKFSSVRNEVAEFFKNETVGKVIKNYDQRENDFLSL
jgi:Rrf2 family transcriptional regulator, iron-sulfur cluster assembly transcription factor